MNNKVVNKQIPLETIVKVAKHLEELKEFMYYFIKVANKLFSK